jgi:hypothetical protein
MAGMRSIHKALGKFPCRKCINKAFGVHLVPNDIRYFDYHEKCTSCGEACNIVADITLTGRAKLLAKRAH